MGGRRSDSDAFVLESSRPLFFDSAVRNKTSQPRELVELVCNAHVALSSSTYVHTYVHIDMLVENCACKKTHDKNADSFDGPGWAPCSGYPYKERS